jgi:hypothetical protein
MKASASAVVVPCFKAFLLPLGAPPAAPCIRQTLDPRSAGARHCNPLRFDFAWHRNARCMFNLLCVGLFSIFFARRAPRRGDAAAGSFGP